MKKYILFINRKHPLHGEYDGCRECHLRRSSFDVPAPDSVSLSDEVVITFSISAAPVKDL